MGLDLRWDVQLILRAERMGAITAADYDAEAIKANPSELCADVHAAGQELPAPMQRLLSASALLSKKNAANTAARGEHHAISR